MYFYSLIYKSHLPKCGASLSQTATSRSLSTSLEISLSYQVIYSYLLDNSVSGPSFVPTVITALHPSNRLWALVCPDLLWYSQAASVDGKDLTGLSICWGLR